MTIRNQFADPFPPDGETFGIITGTFALSRFPNIPGKMFGLKARSTNASSMFIGNASSTGRYPSIPQLPWEIEPGELIGWLPGTNLNQYYIGGCSGSLYLAYWVQG